MKKREWNRRGRLQGSREAQRSGKRCAPDRDTLGPQFGNDGIHDALRVLAQSGLAARANRDTLKKETERWQLTYVEAMERRERRASGTHILGIQTHREHHFVRSAAALLLLGPGSKILVHLSSETEGRTKTITKNVRMQRRIRSSVALEGKPCRAAPPWAPRLQARQRQTRRTRRTNQSPSPQRRSRRRDGSARPTPRVWRRARADAARPHGRSRSEGGWALTTRRGNTAKGRGREKKERRKTHLRLVNFVLWFGCFLGNWCGAF